MKKGLPLLGMAALLAGIVAVLIAYFRTGKGEGSAPVAGVKEAAGTTGQKPDSGGAPPADPGPNPGEPGNGTGTGVGPTGTGSGDPVKQPIKVGNKVGLPSEVHVDLEIDDFNSLPPPPGTADDWQRLAIDRSTDAKMRVQALHALRMNEPEKRTEDVVVAMLDLLRTTEDLALKMGICRNLKGVESAAMRDEMIARLQSDTNEFVRRQAANTLGPMASHPDVRTALENAKANDASPRVKTQAGASLGAK